MDGETTLHPLDLKIKPNVKNFLTEKGIDKKLVLPKGKVI